MKHGPPTLARLVAWSVLLLGLSVGCGSGCGDPVVNPPSSRERPDPDRSTVVVDRAVGLRANGQDSANIQVTVRKADETPLPGRTVKVSVSGEGNTVTQAAPTDAQGVTTVKVTSTGVGTKTVTVSVEAEGGPVTLSSRPTLDFVVLPASKLAFISAPPSGTAGAALGVFDVAIQNADGETMTEATNTLTVALGSGPSGSSLKGTLSARAVNGVARFPELVLEKAARGYTLVASAEGLTGTTSPAFDVASAEMVSLSLSQTVGPVTAGSPLSLEVSALDVFGNAVTDYTGIVHFSSDDGADLLPADYTFTAADAGRHVFNGIVLKKAGARTVMVKDTGPAAFSFTRELAVVAGAPAKLVFTGQPADRRVRTAFGVDVVLLDAAGNRTAAGAPAVTLALDQGGTLEGRVSVMPVDGVASFPGLSIAADAAGYVLTASADGLLSALSNPFTITDDVAPDQPTLVRAALGPVSARINWKAPGDDGALGGVTRYDFIYSTNADLSDPKTVSMRPPQATGANESVLLLNLTPGTTYYVALKVTDNAGNSALSKLEFTTPFPTASKLVFTTQPQSGTAGVKLAPFQVAIQDADGLTVGNDSSLVTLKVNGATGLGTLSVNAVNGVATFDSVRIEKAGKGYTLDASVASSSLTPATSTPFDIAHAPASRLAISGPATTVATRGISVAVTVYDAYDNLAEGYAGSVVLSSNDTAAELPEAWSFSAADKGQHTFPGVVLKTAGSRTVTASASGLTAGTLNVEVTEAPPSKLVLTGLPATMKAGDSVEITVERLNGFDERETGYTGTVRFTSTDAKAPPLGEYTFTTADKGLKTFTVQMRTVGTQTLKVEDTATPSIFAQADSSVTWGAVAKLVLDAADSVKAGDPLHATVTAFDAYDNVVKDYAGNVHFSADPADKATVPGDYAFLPEDQGSRGFDFKLEKAVHTRLTVLDAALNLSASDEVVVSPAEALTLVLAAPMGPFTAGTPFTVEVTLKDAFGNVATGYRGTIGFTASTDSKAVLPDDYTFVAKDNGHQSFQVTLKTAGAQPLAVKDLASTSLTHGTSIQINPDAPKKLAFRDQPQSTKVRTTLAPVSVGLTDTFGNLVDIDSPAITVALSGGNASAVLGGVLTVVPDHGIATFPDLTVDQQGTGFQLVVSGTDLSDATSAAFDITDDVAPGVAWLSVDSKTSIQVKLSWVPVGDDGSSGTASSYDLRYSKSEITEASFESLVDKVSTGKPKAPGSPEPETVTVTGLSPSTPYYFALKVRDDAGNSSFFVTQAVETNASPCAVDSCAAPSFTCAADGVSRITTTETCVDVNNSPSCQQTQTSTTCPGDNGVCFQGQCDTAAAPTADQLSISEVMHNPNTGTTQYIEVSNNTSNLLNLNGLVLTHVNGESSSSFTVGEGGSVPVVIGRKGTFVLAQNTDIASNGGVFANVAYGNTVTLGGSGVLRLTHGDTTVEDFTYDTTSFPQTHGKAMSLSSVVMGTKAHAQPWYWCDSEGTLLGGDFGTPNAPNSSCGVAATAPVDFCAIQYPKTFPSGDGKYPDTVTPGSSWTILSQFREPGMTDRNKQGNDFYPYVSAELGYGTDATNPAAWTTWTPVFFNGGYSSGSSDFDEMVGTLTLPSTPGTYRYGFRYRLQDPATGDYSDYVYCDQSGAVTPPAGNFGSVTVAEPPPPPPVTTDHVVISEFAGAGPGGANDEFIELYNPTASDVTLNGSLQYKSGTGNWVNVVTLSGTIRAHGFYLIAFRTKTGGGYTGTAQPDLTYNALSTSATIGSLRILDKDGKELDRLGWGGSGSSPEGSGGPLAGSNGSVERKAYTTSTAKTMEVTTSGTGADANHGNGTDTNDNASDFIVRTLRDPQNAASPVELP